MYITQLAAVEKLRDLQHPCTIFTAAPRRRTRGPRPWSAAKPSRGCRSETSRLGGGAIAERV